MWVDGNIWVPEYVCLSQKKNGLDPLSRNYWIPLGFNIFIMTQQYKGELPLWGLEWKESIIVEGWLAIFQRKLLPASIANDQTTIKTVLMELLHC